MLSSTVGIFLPTEHPLNKEAEKLSSGLVEKITTELKLIQRRAYGFRNFNNYRLRVIAECG